MSFNVHSPTFMLITLLSSRCSRCSYMVESIPHSLSTKHSSFKGWKIGNKNDENNGKFIESLFLALNIGILFVDFVYWWPLDNLFLICSLNRYAWKAWIDIYNHNTMSETIAVSALRYSLCCQCLWSWSVSQCLNKLDGLFS